MLGQQLHHYVPRSDVFRRVIATALAKIKVHEVVGEGRVCVVGGGVVWEGLDV